MNSTDVDWVERYIANPMGSLFARIIQWRDRHLNWSMVIGYLFSFALLPIFFGVNPLKDWSIYDSIPTLIGWIIVTIWGLKRKERSRWYLLTIFIPIVGWLIPALISGRQDMLEKIWAKNRSAKRNEIVVKDN